MPIPHFNTSEFFIKNNDTVYDNEDDNEYAPQNDDIYYPTRNFFTAEQDAFLDSTDDDDNDSQEAPNEETTQTEEPIQTTSSNMSSLNRLEIQPSGVWVDNNTIEYNHNKSYLHYCNILNELYDLIDYEYDEWRLTVINHYRNDNVMDDLIEEVQKYKNILSALFDLINNDYSINTDDKNDLFASIIDLNNICEKAITYSNN